MVEHIAKARLLPLTVIFLCAVIPNTIKSFDGVFECFYTGFCVGIFAIYVYLMIHCVKKLRKIRRELT